jgi:hypothetical protein
MYSRYVNCTLAEKNEIDIGGDLLYISDTEAYYDEDGFMEIKYHLINETKKQDEHLYLNIDFSTNCDYQYPTTGKVVKIVRDTERRDYVINRHCAQVNFDSNEKRIEVLEDLLTYNPTRMTDVNDRAGVFGRVL